MDDSFNASCNLVFHLGWPMGVPFACFFFFEPFDFADGSVATVELDVVASMAVGAVCSRRSLHDWSFPMVISAVLTAGSSFNSVGPNVSAVVSSAVSTGSSSCNLGGCNASAAVLCTCGGASVVPIGLPLLALSAPPTRALCFDVDSVVCSEVQQVHQQTLQASMQDWCLHPCPTHWQLLIEKRLPWLVSIFATFAPSRLQFRQQSFLQPHKAMS